MNTFSHVPPGFRFHPTDEELVDYYLRKKVASKRIDLDVIKEIDLYKIEPWDIQERCKIGSEEQNEWYFFSHKDKKYPTGTRTNRATTAGFWKATGRDKPIYSKLYLVGMRKTLVFYQGRAPNGQKSDWIMHEYRLETNENGAPQEEGWVVCRVFKKRPTSIRRSEDNDSHCWYDDQVAAPTFLPDLELPPYHPSHLHPAASFSIASCKQEMGLGHYQLPHETPFMQLPQLESPKLPTSYFHQPIQCSPCIQKPSSASLEDQHPSYVLCRTAQHHVMPMNQPTRRSASHGTGEQVTDWRVLDKFVASQLSQDDETKKDQTTYTSPDGVAAELLLQASVERQQESFLEYASTSTSSGGPIDLWK